MNRLAWRLAITGLVLLPAAGVAALAPDSVARLLTLVSPRAGLVFARDDGARGEALAAAGRWAEAAAAFRAARPAQSYNVGTALARLGDLDGALAAFDAALLAGPGEEDASFNRALVTEALYRRRLAEGGSDGAANSAASLRGKGRLDRMDSGDTLSGTGDGMAAGRASRSQLGQAGSGSAAGQGAGRESEDSGDGAAHGAASDAAGKGRKGGGADSIAEAWREREHKSTRSLEAQWIEPSEAWLASVADDPRKYLKTRLLGEKKQRLRASVNAGTAP